MTRASSCFEPAVARVVGLLATLCSALCVLAASPAGAQTPANPQLDRALDSYATALVESDRDTRLAGFALSERQFASVVESGAHNAALYTNLGNAALQAEHRGQAVLAYRRALALDADFSRALQNLEHVRTLLPGWVPRPEPAGVFDTFFFYRALPIAERALGGAVAFALAGLLIALSIRFEQGVLRGVGALVLVVWALLVGSVVLDRSDEATRRAVLTADEAVARSADSALAPLAFAEPLPGGTEVTWLEQRSPWVRVRLANGRDAWVNESSVTRVSR